MNCEKCHKPAGSLVDGACINCHDHDMSAISGWAEHAAYPAFVEEMRGKTYGDDALTDAWLWFRDGHAAGRSDALAERVALEQENATARRLLQFALDDDVNDEDGNTPEWRASRAGWDEVRAFLEGKSIAERPAAPEPRAGEAGLCPRWWSGMWPVGAPGKPRYACGEPAGHEGYCGPVRWREPAAPKACAPTQAGTGEGYASRSGGWHLCLACSKESGWSRRYAGKGNKKPCTVCGRGTTNLAYGAVGTGRK